MTPVYCSYQIFFSEEVFMATGDSPLDEESLDVLRRLRLEFAAFKPEVIEGVCALLHNRYKRDPLRELSPLAVEQDAREELRRLQEQIPQKK
jgi:hypothetical protein